jgi:glycosyltransferase involved in cell wall biosynthesis
MRFHVLGIPHTASNKDYSGCAFTQKVVTLCKMLKMRGHEVLHYGNELSRVECDENIPVTHAGDIEQPERALIYSVNSPVYAKFNALAFVEIGRRKQSNDFLLCTFGAGHKQLADWHADMIVVESGIGYPGGFFAPFKVFESYAILHARYGLQAIERAGDFKWYEVVIPNAFDPQDFLFRCGERDDYLLFLGMRHGGEGKGFSISRDAARDAGRKLIVAGPDSERGKIEDHVEHFGLIGVAERAQLLSRARAVMCPSIFLEPMCGVQMEAFFSGTPVISTDWGAFAEYNLHGVTGYRCRTHEQFVWAINHAHEIDAFACRQWAIANFTLNRIAVMYDEFFESLMAIRTGKGWYEPNAGRRDLDYLTKITPRLGAVGEMWRPGASGELKAIGGFK